MRRLLAGLGVGVGLGVAGWWLASEPEVVPIEVVRLSTGARTRTVVLPSAPPPPGVAVPEVPADGSAAERRFTRVVSDLTQRCGLVPTVVCDGARCVALAEAPDLDAASGWVQMAVQHPRFVASTAMRDLGVPATALPCGDAIAGLSHATEQEDVALVERADGSEVWCAGPTDLCDAAALELGLRAEGFARPDARRLRFQR